MKAYVIGRKGRHRNSELLSVLAAHFEEVVRADGFVAVKPTDLETRLNHEFFRAVHRRAPLLGELGCGLAHIEAWRFLANSNLDCLAIFEDDAEIDEVRIPSVLAEVTKLTEPWCLSLSMTSSDRLVTHLIPRGKAVRRAIIQPRATVGYVISRKAAQLGVADFDRSGGLLEGTSDRWPGPAGLLRYYTAVPAVVGTNDGGESYIGRRSERPEPWLVRLKRFASLLLDPTIPSYKKRGLLILKLLRPIKFAFSVFFLTEWYRIRWGDKRG